MSCHLQYIFLYTALMTSPMMLTSCGHTFEEKTIREWLAKQNKCPLCNKPAEVSMLMKNFALA